jgi:hypothetical protein
VALPYGEGGMHTHLLEIKKPLAGAVSHFALLHFTIRYRAQVGGHFKSQSATRIPARPPHCICRQTLQAATNKAKTAKRRVPKDQTVVISSPMHA